MTGNSIIIAIIAAILLAALGMRIAGGEPSKGAVLAVGFLAGTIGASVVAKSLLLSIIAGAVVASVVSGALKLPAKQSANALLGSAVGYLIPFLLM